MPIWLLPFHRINDTQAGRRPHSPIPLTLYVCTPPPPPLETAVATVVSLSVLAMPTILSLSLIFLLLLSPALGSETEGEKNFVLTLDASNFTETVAKHAFIVVEFYAPWCGHCVKLAPEYEKAASVLASHDPPLVLAKVDATEEKNKEIAGQFEVKGFPTIKILRNGGKTSQEYKGTREADGIVAYLKRQAGPASVEITSPEDVGRLFDDRKAYIVGIFPQLSGEEFENFTAVAEKLRSDYDFGHTLEAKYLPRGESAATGPLVRLFKPFDEMVLDFQDFHLEVVEEFIKKSSIPTVTLFDKDPINHPYLMKFFDSSDAKAMLFINFTSESLEAFKSKLHEVASNYKGKGISFLLADAEAAQGAFKFFGAREDMVPVMVISKGEEEEKYLKPNLEPDHIASWLRDFTEGKLQPFKKTEPIPESNNEPVKVVVAATLQEMVFNSGKNVLLEFYAPWCGHCKKLAPTLDEVALFFETNKDVIIAKIDATANDVPSSTFKVTGFPTLYLVSANGKVVQYEGDRSKDDIIGFVQKNSDSTAGQAESTTPSVKDEL